MFQAGEKQKYHIHGLLPSNKFEESGKFKSKTGSKILWDLCKGNKAGNRIWGPVIESLLWKGK